MKCAETVQVRPGARAMALALLTVLVISCKQNDSGNIDVKTDPFETCWASVWEKPTNWLETVDSGQVNQQMIDEFDAEPTNFHAVGLMGDPFVVYDQSKYRMWFSSTAMDGDGNETQGIAYSESTDGKTWSDPKDALSLVKLQISPEDSSWPIRAIETPSVIKVDGVYYLYFSGRYQDQAFKIGLATSVDGYTWHVHEQSVLEASLSWEQVQQNDSGELFGGVLEPSVIYDPETGTFNIWYTSFGMSDNQLGGSIGLATSYDGIHWDKRDDPVFSPGESGAWDDALVGHVSVEKEPDGHYHMFYAGFPTGNSSPVGIGHAISVDGINWVRNPSNPIVSTDRSWHTAFVGGPTSLITDGTMNLWYMGANNTEFGFVHFAKMTSTCVQ